MELRWGPWRPQLTATHIDPSCSSCNDPGPGEFRWGYTEQDGESRISHYASRCKACGETFTYLRGTGTDLTELPGLYVPPDTTGAPMLAGLQDLIRGDDGS